MITVTKRLEWDAAHRVLRHESKCGTLHGHRYAAEITCEAPSLDHCGRVVDFGVIKERVGRWIDDNWDHTTLVNRNDEALLSWCRREQETLGKRAPYVFENEPTAEYIAIELHHIAASLLHDTGVRIRAIKVYETPTSCATYQRGDRDSA